MGGRLEREVAAWVDGPCRARGAEASCVGERQNTNMESGGDGRLEREVAAWAEGACRARGEGEWMVVMVSAKEGQQSHASLSNSFLTLPLSHLPPAFCVLVLRCAYTAAKEGQQSHPSHARREGCCSPRLDALPCPLPPLHLPCECFLLSTSLVAEMRGSMAVLSDSVISTTILLALPLSAPPPPNQTWGQQQQALGGREGQSRGVQQHWMQGPRGHSWSSSLHSVLLSPVAPLSPIAPLSPLNPLSPAAPLSPVSLRLQAMPELSPHLGAGGFGSSLGGSSMGVVGGVVGGGLGGGAGGVEAAVRAAVAGRRVAVVDDNAVNRMVARRTLQGYGADVLLLASGEDTLQAVSSHMDPSPHPPSSCLQLLLLDLHMPPGIDG
ncbi:unnamed protein product [Closterium sp. NIES-64]|nr:unnamed protein product [Closterium sp. NIES-64]